MEGLDPAQAAPLESSTLSIGSSLGENSGDSDSFGRYNLLGEDEHEDEEGDVCRICRNPGEPDNPLCYPCACSGSIKFVHPDCFLQWLKHSNARQCEICRHPLLFSPVYAENAPARLPFQEFIVGIAMQACHVLLFFLRPSFVLSVWLLIIPFITFWIWRLAFVRSFGEAHRLFLSHLSTTVILTDCLHGFLHSASILFLFLGIVFIVRRYAAQANRNIPVDWNDEDAGGAQGIAGAGQMIRRNAANVAARWVMQVARLEAQVEQMFGGLDDAELVDMQGPVFHSVENAFTVLAINMIFLGVVIFVPFSLGRVILYYFTWLLSSATNPLSSTVVPLTEPTLSLANTTLKSVLAAVVNLTYDNHGNSLLGQVAEILKANETGQAEVSSNVSSTIATDILKVHSVGGSRLSDVTTLAVGYMFIFSLGVFYLGIVTSIWYSRGEPLTMGRFYGFASVAETIASLFRQFVAAMRHLMTMIKVALLLVIELGGFPLMCGWWMDACTIRMFGKSISQRAEFFSVSPLASSLVHWVVGVVYMFLLCYIIKHLYKILRNEDLNIPPYLFRDLVDDPAHKHALRVLFRVAVYESLIVILVFLPARLAMRMVPSIFPLDISVSDPFTEIPAGMLLFQIFVPFAIKHFKLQHTHKSLLRYWFTAVGWALGLTDFLLPKPGHNGGHDNGNTDVGRHDRGHGQAVVQERVVALEDVNRPRHVVAANANPAEVLDADEPVDPAWGFVLRIVLLLVVAWMTLLVFNSLLIVIPISLGRALFNALPLLPVTHGIRCNDLSAFVIGSYVILTGLAGARYCLDLIRTRRTRLLLDQIRKWCGIIVKSFVLLSIWVFVIPVLIGLLFELLVIVPMRVSMDESPVFLLYQDWALGLVFLKIWTRMVMLDHMMALVDESWRVKLERVREYGFSRLQGLWVLGEIMSPIIMKLLTALCVPYILSRGVFPIFGYPLMVNSVVYHFAWLGCLLLSVIFFCAKRFKFHVWLTHLHNSIRDERYLIGHRLHNFGDNAAAASNNQVSVTDVNVNENLGIRHSLIVR